MKIANTTRNQKGFTLIELLLASTIVLALSGFILFPLVGYKNTEEFNTQEKLIVAMMRSAQERSITREVTTNGVGVRWGVRFINNIDIPDTFALFAGEGPVGQNYGCSNPTLQTVAIVETRTLKNSSEFRDPAPGCAKDIVFTPGSGIPSPLDADINQITIEPKGFDVPLKNITINPYGIISF